MTTSIMLYYTIHTCVYNLFTDGIDFAVLTAMTITLTPNVHKSCVSLTIVDDSVFEKTECLNMSITVTGELNKSVDISEEAASICITDNDGELL